MTPLNNGEATWWRICREGGVVEDPVPVAVRLYRPATPGDSAKMGITLQNGHKTTNLQEASDWLYCRTEQEALDVKQKYEHSATAYADNEAVKTILTQREELARMQAEIDALKNTSGEVAVQALVVFVKAYCAAYGDVGVRLQVERDEDYVKLVTEHRTKPDGHWYWFGHCSMSKVEEYDLSRFIKDHAGELIDATAAGGGVLEVYADGSVINIKED